MIGIHHEVTKITKLTRTLLYGTNFVAFVLFRAFVMRVGLVANCG
jgi:hypothetical protein